MSIPHRALERCTRSCRRLQSAVRPEGIGASLLRRAASATYLAREAIAAAVEQPAELREPARCSMRCGTEPLADVGLSL